MDFSDSQFTQLILALFIGLLLFLMTYAASEKSVITLLVATLPFQPITSSFGTLNTVAIYMVGVIFLLKGRIKKLPILWGSLFIIFALLLSTSQVHKSTYLDHFFYIVTIVANFILFYLVYNYFVQKKVDPSYAINVFIFCGTLVLLASTLKLVFQFDLGVAIGVGELTTRGNLEQYQRFIGSFGAAGINGAFHGTQMIIIAAMLMLKPKPLARFILIALFVGNASFLIATGSRGAFLSTVGGLVLLLFMFSRRLGTGKVIALGVMLPMLFAVGAVVIIKFTSYNVLFDRLQNTEFRGLTPESRDFSIALDRIPEALFLGHGPRLNLPDQWVRRIPGYTPMPYPHNLYLYILFTVGTFGLIAYFAWFLKLATSFLRPLKYSKGTTVLEAAPRLAIVVLIAFLVDELKIEFLRFTLSDYQQFMFALFGMLLALSDRALEDGRKSTALARLDKLANAQHLSPDKDLKSL